MSPEDAFRRVLAARLPAGPGWTAWIDGTVTELAAADAGRRTVERDTIRHQQQRIQAALDLCEKATDDRYEWDGEKVVFVSDLREALDAPVEAS